MKGSNTMNVETIRNQNDLFRLLGNTSYVPGKVVTTPGVEELSPDNQRKLFKLVQTFSDFNEENDPYSEHDFGSVELNGGTYFWKIDYYDTDYQFGSTNPADISKTRRVLTIMKANDY